MPSVNTVPAAFDAITAERELDDNSAAAHEFSIRKKIVLVIFVMAFVIMIIGTVPAAFDAITAEKGFTVENVVPMEPAMKIAPTTTMES